MVEFLFMYRTMVAGSRLARQQFLNSRDGRRWIAFSKQEGTYLA